MCLSNLITHCILSLHLSITHCILSLHLLIIRDIFSLLLLIIRDSFGLYFSIFHSVFSLGQLIIHSILSLCLSIVMNFFLTGNQLCLIKIIFAMVHLLITFHLFWINNFIFLILHLRIPFLFYIFDYDWKITRTLFKRITSFLLDNHLFINLILWEVVDSFDFKFAKSILDANIFT